MKEAWVQGLLVPEACEPAVHPTGEQVDPALDPGGRMPRVHMLEAATLLCTLLAELCLAAASRPVAVARREEHASGLHLARAARWARPLQRIAQRRGQGVNAGFFFVELAPQPRVLLL
jgi:hypothetical protein